MVNLEAKLNLSEIAKVWLACAIDSEGFIRVSESKGRYDSEPMLGISNTNFNFIKHAHELCSLGRVHKNHYKNSKVNAEGDIYNYRVYGKRKVGLLLQELLPYLIVKKVKAESLLKWLELHPMGNKYPLHKKQRGGKTVIEC